MPSEPRPDASASAVSIYVAATGPAFLSITLAGSLIGLVLAATLACRRHA